MADNQECSECQSDAPTTNSIKSHQLEFRIAIKKDMLTPRAIQSFYFEWSIFTNPVDIDGPEDNVLDADKQPGIEENSKPDSSDEEEDEENEPDSINSIDKSG